MKKLFFLLLVINLLLWLWFERERLEPLGDLAEPGPGVIRVLDEAEVAARREQVARAPAVPEPEPVREVAGGVREPGVAPPSAPVRTAAAERALATALPAGSEASGAEPSPPASPPDPGAPARTAEPAASPPPAVAKEPPLAVAEVLYLCESVGPFPDRAAAARQQAALAAPFRAVATREERVTRPGRYWALAVVEPNEEALAAYRRALEEAGVRDAWRIPRGPLAGRLAVGVFQSAENAGKHRDMLARRGLAVEIRSPENGEHIYWVDYERPADADAPDIPVGRDEAARRIEPRACPETRADRPGANPG